MFTTRRVPLASNLHVQQVPKNGLKIHVGLPMKPRASTCQLAHSVSLSLSRSVSAFASLPLYDMALHTLKTPARRAISVGQCYWPVSNQTACSPIFLYHNI